MTSDASLPADRPRLLSAKAAAEFCGVSHRTWRTWDAGGRVPQALEIGRSKFWRRVELEQWIDHGCPNRAAWQVLSSGEMS